MEDGLQRPSRNYSISLVYILKELSEYYSLAVVNMSIVFHLPPLLGPHDLSSRILYSILPDFCFSLALL